MNPPPAPTIVPNAPTERPKSPNSTAAVALMGWPASPAGAMTVPGPAGAQERNRPPHLTPRPGSTGRRAMT